MTQDATETRGRCTSRRGSLMTRHSQSLVACHLVSSLNVSPVLSCRDGALLARRGTSDETVLSCHPSDFLSQKAGMGMGREGGGSVQQNLVICVAGVSVAEAFPFVSSG